MTPVPPPVTMCAAPPQPIPDAGHLLALVADALNQCERHGLIVDLEHGAVMSTKGYVLPGGDSRLGSRWVVRRRLEPEGDEAINDNRATCP